MLNVGIAIINHPPFITMFMGGINSPSKIDGWFMALRQTNIIGLL